MIDAFVTRLPAVMERRNRPEREIRAEGEEQGLTPEQIAAEVYRHHHFAPHAVMRLLTDNRDWAFRCEEHMKRISVPTLVLVADVEAGGYMRPEELAYYRSIATPRLQFRFWEGVGHGMHAARPQQFNRELAEFLAQHA